MTGEEIGFAMEQLLSGGALDVFTTPIGMKKNRPGVLLSVLCRACDRETMARLIFRHTTTLGIRESLQNRYTLERRTQTVSTPTVRFGRRYPPVTASSGRRPSMRTSRPSPESRG